MSIEVDVSAFLNFAEAMGAADDRVRAELLKAGNQVAQQGAQIAQSILASNGSIASGDLYNDITGRPAQMAGDTIIIEYGPNSEYPGTWVEKGRRPVSARPGGMLKFQIKGRGPVIFARSVRAAPARPFMKPSEARIRPIATKMLGEAAMRAVEGMI
jgi:hypothetical protein